MSFLEVPQYDIITTTALLAQYIYTDGTHPIINLLPLPVLSPLGFHILTLQTTLLSSTPPSSTPPLRFHSPLRWQYPSGKLSLHAHPQPSLLCGREAEAAL